MQISSSCQCAGRGVRRVEQVAEPSTPTSDGVVPSAQRLGTAQGHRTCREPHNWFALLELLSGAVSLLCYREHLTESVRNTGPMEKHLGQFTLLIGPY